MNIVRGKLTKEHAFLGLRLFMGGMFVYASFNKIIYPADFAYAIFRYKILPDSLINIAAVILPWVEFVMGACLILGIGLSGAALLLSLLLASFLGALVFNMVRGLNIDCGCFELTGGAVSQMTMVWYVIRDSVLLAFALRLYALALRKASREGL